MNRPKLTIKLDSVLRTDFDSLSRNFVEENVDVCVTWLKDYISSELFKIEKYKLLR